MALPLTEQVNPDTEDIDRCGTLAILQKINREDRRVAEAAEKCLEALVPAVEAAAERLARGGRMFYFGAGTSGRIGVLDASECACTYGVPPDMVQAVIPGGYENLPDAALGDEDDTAAAEQEIRVRGIGEKDVVVGIAASGTTPYVLAAVRAARRAGAYTVGVCNNPDTPLERETDTAAVLLTGPEVIQGSTRMKAGTSAKLVLNMLSTAVMIRLGRVYRNRMVEITAFNEKSRRRCVGILCELTGVGEAQAVQTLAACGFVLKPALVCCLTGCTPQQAKAQLAEHGGHIAQLLDARQTPETPKETE